MINRFQNSLRKLSEGDTEKLIFVLIFILNCLMVLFYLTPRFLEINPEDGAKYIESGRKLLIWGLRDLSWGPLVAFIYAPIHLFVGNSPNWFMLEAWIGNIIFFGLMWFSFFNLARALGNHISKFIFVGLLFSWVYYYRILYNQSDALFLPLSVFALTSLIRFKQQKRIKYIWLASLFVGLGVLSRVETILLVIPLVLFSLWFNQRHHKRYHVLLASLLPIAGILLLFIIVSLLTVGHTNVGTGGKAYFSYTHPLVQNFIGGSKNHQAYLKGEPIFGTYQENQGSLIRAILRNPSVLAERILANLLELPVKLREYYGIYNRWVLVLFGLFGFYQLIKAKDLKLLLILLVWPLHATVALVFERLHFIPQISYFLLVFSSVGITYLLSNQAGFVEKLILTILSVVLMIVTFISQSHSILAFSVLLCVVSIVNLLVDRSKEKADLIKTIPAVLLLAGMLVFEQGFVFPTLQLGQTEDEKAIHVLQSSLPYQSNVMAYFSRSAVAAKMERTSFPEDITEVDAFIDYLRDNKVSAIYEDGKMPFPTDMVQVVLNEHPELLTLIHKSESGKLKIYKVTSPGK